MVFNFSLPTTSHLSFQSRFSSPTHPSLPQSASTARHALRQSLKKHKRLTPAQRASHLPQVLAALNEYIPYVFALYRGLDSEEGGIEVVPGGAGTDIEPAWRPTLSSRSSLSLQRLKHRGRSARVAGCGLEFEIAFVLLTLGYVLSGLARARYLSTLYSIKTPTTEEKTAAVTGAMKDLLTAASVHRYLAESSTMSQLKALSLSEEPSPSPSSAAAMTTRTTSTTATSSTSIAATTSTVAATSSIPDLNPAMQSALASLALAEATLLAVLKDDAYLTTCIQARNPQDKDWMVKAPDIPKVRALLFARLCARAAEYAEQAHASASSVRAAGKESKDKDEKTMEVDAEVLGYMRVLGRVARAKACRFLAIDAEIGGRVGEGIAWLRAGRSALGIRTELEGDTPGGKEKKKERGLGFSKLKREWEERREERRVEKQAGLAKAGSDGGREADLDWGDDAGREEEARVIDMLETKWMKMNEMVNTQAIPSSASFLSNLPSGRDIHSSPAPYVPPRLDEEQLARMRAPPDRSLSSEDPGSSDEEDEPVRDGYY